MRIADELQVDCPVFYVDNVAEYWSHRWDSGDRVKASELPTLAPAFPRMWFEWRIAPRVTRPIPHSDERSKEATEYEAVEIVAEEIVGGGWKLLMSPWSRMGEFDYQETPKGEWHRKEINAVPIKWTTWELILGPGGEVVDSTNGPVFGAANGHEDLMTFPALMALAFMHCKNIRHVEREPVYYSGKGWRSVKPKHVRHYTLEIDPMREVLRREGNAEAVGLARALHICRGHFKDYRQSGLFGKIKGIFWWDSMVRGKPEHGQVVKDYAVKAPTETIQ